MRPYTHDDVSVRLAGSAIRPGMSWLDVLRDLYILRTLALLIALCQRHLSRESLLTCTEAESKAQGSAP